MLTISSIYYECLYVWVFNVGLWFLLCLDWFVVSTRVGLFALGWLDSVWVCLWFVWLIVINSVGCRLLCNYICLGDLFWWCCLVWLVCYFGVFALVGCYVCLFSGVFADTICLLVVLLLYVLVWLIWCSLLVVVGLGLVVWFWLCLRWFVDWLIICYILVVILFWLGCLWLFY